MKRKILIITLWLLLLASLYAMVHCVDNYIYSKRECLRYEIRENINHLFEGQPNGDILEPITDDASNSLHPVRNYKKISIPSEPDAITKHLFGEEVYREWKDLYSDLENLYELNWDDDYPNNNDEGWSIMRVHCNNSNDWIDDSNILKTSIIFPYQVGIKSNDSFYSCTVEEAVKYSFNFYFKNRDKDYVKEGTIDRLWKKIHDCENEYFYIAENKEVFNRSKQIHNPNVVLKLDDNNFLKYERKNSERAIPEAYEDWCIYNDFYRVFIASKDEYIYMIKEKDGVVEANKKELLLLWGIGLPLIFLSIIIPLTIKEYRVNKKKSETLYQRLCRMCNPSNFIRDYDKDKIDKANELYQRIVNIKPDDKDGLMVLQAEAVASLGIVLIDEDELKDLMKFVNPKRFMKPYNAEKIRVANDLYSRLMKDGLSYEEFMKIKEESRSLL